MCGACGAGSGRSAPHWSGPFLASVPARSAAARTLTVWARATGWSGTVSGVAGGFQVATASGRRSLAVDLVAALEQLAAIGVRVDRLLDGSASGVVEGPPTRPGPRPHASTPDRVSCEADVADRLIQADGSTSWALPIDPRRHYRVPGLLAWLAVAHRTGALGRAAVHLGLGGGTGMLIVTGDDGVITCDAAPAPACDVVLASDPGPGVGLLALLCPVIPRGLAASAV